MSDPDTGRFDEFSAERENHFRTDIDHESAVQAAGKIMAKHAEQIEGDPLSVVDVLIDELSVEQKKEHPDPDTIADIQKRLQAEHPYVATQVVTSDTALRHINDHVESHELNDQEQARREIPQYAESVPGFYQDILAMMADIAVTTVPDSMRKIVTKSKNIFETTYQDVGTLLGKIPMEQVSAVLKDDVKLRNFDSYTLQAVARCLKKAQDKLNDEHTSMLKATSDWREQHKEQS